MCVLPTVQMIKEKKKKKDTIVMQTGSTEDCFAEFSVPVSF